MYRGAQSGELWMALWKRPGAMSSHVTSVRPIDEKIFLDPPRLTEISDAALWMSPTEFGSRLPIISSKTRRTRGDTYGSERDHDSRR
jgi:hypothetical protein